MKKLSLLPLLLFTQSGAKDLPVCPPSDSCSENALLESYAYIESVLANEDVNKWLYQSRMRKDLPSSTYQVYAPSFTLTTSNGNTLSFHDLHFTEVKNQICKTWDWDQKCGPFYKKTALDLAKKHQRGLESKIIEPNEVDALRNQLRLEANLPEEEDKLSLLKITLEALENDLLLEANGTASFASYASYPRSNRANYAKIKEKIQEVRKQKEILEKKIKTESQKIDETLHKKLRESIDARSKPWIKADCETICQKFKEKFKSHCEDVFQCMSLDETTYDNSDSSELDDSSLPVDALIQNISKQRVGVDSDGFSRTLIASYQSSMNRLAKSFEPSFDFFCERSTPVNEESLRRGAMSKEERDVVIETLSHEMNRFRADNEEESKKRDAISSLIQEIQSNPHLLVLRKGVKSSDSLKGTVLIYPNPSKGLGLKVRLKAQEKLLQPKPIKISVFDAAGKEVSSMHQTLTQQEEEISLDFADLNRKPSGNYFLVIEGGSFPSRKFQIVK